MGIDRVGQERGRSGWTRAKMDTGLGPADAERTPREPSGHNARKGGCMTLDEYRTQIIESLKARPDIVGARDLLAQTHLVLINSGISAQTQTRFWESLNDDLELLEQESTLLEEHAANTLRAVVAAVQAVIAQYQRLIAIAQHKP